MTDDDYTCIQCGMTFSKGWSDAEAEAELNAEFPGFSPQECDYWCDDCYKALQELMSHPEKFFKLL